MKSTSYGKAQSVARVIQMERFAFESKSLMVERGDPERQNYLKYKGRKNGVIRIKRDSLLSQRLKKHKKEM